MHCRCIGVASKYLLQLLHDLLEGRLQLLGHSPLHCRQLAQRVVFLHTHIHTASLYSRLNVPLAAMHTSLCRDMLLVCNMGSIRGQHGVNMQYAVMHAICAQMIDFLVSDFPLSATFAACSLTQKPHDCVDNMVCVLGWTPYIRIPGRTAPVQMVC